MIFDCVTLIREQTPILALFGTEDTAPTERRLAGKVVENDIHWPVEKVQRVRYVPYIGNPKMRKKNCLKNEN